MKLAASKIIRTSETQPVAGFPDAISHQSSMPMKKEHYGI